ncbi:hypothetical protein NP493_551g03036 [Ridgeia piscesae]|uniref:Fucolectin tachylectin-4 pentraxin-1 domain-containing protein n=1 Tax=Ridgeia piscesae TaxID=27915 RepID=A0AAD9NRU4_RIDPI|nr:hypothetical protein NP493_551g03036 [Ridgeia piscesae]
MDSSLPVVFSPVSDSGIPKNRRLVRRVRAIDNVALSRPTRQSSVFFGATSDRANDGNIDGHFSDKSCTFTATNLDYPWWAVDLESERHVRSVIIYNRLHDVRADDNVALGRPTRQSSEANGASSDRANDGNTNGELETGQSCAVTTDKYPNPWWAVDLGSERLVRSLVIYNRVHLRQERLRDLRVGMMDTWPTGKYSLLVLDAICATRDGPHPEARLIIPCEKNATGRYLVIQIAAPNHKMTLCEVEVFAYTHNKHALIFGRPPSTGGDETFSMSIRPLGYKRVQMLPQSPGYCVIDTHWWTQLVNTVTYQDVSESPDYCVFNTHWWTQLVNTVMYQDVPESPDYGVFNTHWWAQFVNTVTFQEVSESPAYCVFNNHWWAQLVNTVT